MRLSPDIRFGLKVVSVCAVAVAVEVAVEVAGINYYGWGKTTHYHLVVDPSLSPYYDIAAQAATNWVQAVGDAHNLDISVEMRECPDNQLQNDTVCVIFTPTHIQCLGPTTSNVGCSTGYTVWVDTELGATVSNSILIHELGHQFGIPDMDDPYPGVMNRIVNPFAPRSVIREDVEQYYRYR
jgi:hypothetical protein